jgi:tRNA 5-methylaminomethyl-2-thiouridine biosynthesis bifunctional protein
MPEADFPPLTPARLHWDGDTPRSPDYGDPYFAHGRGPAEARTVFLAGNALESRFRRLPARADFVLGETGFGTGLNFLCAAEHFLEHAPPDARLHYLSTELHPLEPADLEQALRHAPDPQGLAGELHRHYPPPTPGFHRLTLAGGRVVLTLLLGEATTLLGQLDAEVHAWFLDGFAPARNPELWSPGLFTELARLSRPGTTLATYTAAGFVRRGLENAGFRMEKVAGFEGKRHRLNGSMPETGRTRTQSTPDSITIVGAGLAGATTARALAERGHSVRVLDAGGVAAGASGNRAGVLYTTPSAHPTPQNRFYQGSFLQALHWLHRYGFPRSPDEGALAGVVQQPADARTSRKMLKARESGLWPPALAAFSEVDGEPRLELPGGGYIAPAAWCAFLLDHPGIALEQARVEALTPDTGGWQLATDQGEFRAHAVILANAGDARHLAGLTFLPLHRIRGQVSYVRATAESARWRRACCHRGYLTPALDGLHCVGATFAPRDDDAAPRDADDRANLDTLRRYRPDDWQALGGEAIELVDRRVGFRWQSPDFLPLVGPATRADGTTRAGLYLNIAHGSRGITGTPLCAEILAAHIDGEPAAVDREVVEALLPKRFTGHSADQGALS